MRQKLFVVASGGLMNTSVPNELVALVACGIQLAGDTLLARIGNTRETPRFPPQPAIVASWHSYLPHFLAASPSAARFKTRLMPINARRDRRAIKMPRDAPAKSPAIVVSLLTMMPGA